VKQTTQPVCALSTTAMEGFSLYNNPIHNGAVDKVVAVFFAKAMSAITKIHSSNYG
jgi:hypothetical protein